MVVRDIHKSEVHEINFALLADESTLALGLLQDIDQGSECSLPRVIGHSVVRVLADLPEAIDVEVQACIDLTGWILFGALALLVLILASKEVFDLRCARLRVLLLVANLGHGPHVRAVFEEDSESPKRVLFQEINSHVIILRYWQLLDEVVELGQLLDLQVGYHFFDNGECSTDYILMLLRGTLPYRLNDAVLERVLLVNGSNVDKLE